MSSLFFLILTFVSNYPLAQSGVAMGDYQTCLQDLVATQNRYHSFLPQAVWVLDKEVSVLEMRSAFLNESVRELENSKSPEILHRVGNVTEACRAHLKILSSRLLKFVALFYSVCGIIVILTLELLFTKLRGPEVEDVDRSHLVSR